MRLYKKFSAVVVVLIALFSTSFGYSQDMLQGEPSPEIKEWADETMEMWISELALSAKQEALMEKEIIEYAMKREELLNSRISEGEKKQNLLALQDLEREAMQDILRQPQYEKYLFIQEQRLDREK